MIYIGLTDESLLSNGTDVAGKMEHFVDIQPVLKIVLTIVLITLEPDSISTNGNALTLKFIT